MGHRRTAGDLSRRLLLIGTVVLAASCKDPPKPDPPPPPPPKLVPTQEVIAPEDMVLIEASTFTMGSDQGKEYERPARKVSITRPYMIDKTEVTAEAYDRCVRAGACKPTSIHGPAATSKSIEEQSSLCNATAPDRAQHPVNCIDLQQASAYCAYAGKRLPTEAEWERAARGVDGRTYPWGEDISGCKQAIIGGCLRGTSPVAQRPENKSPTGAFDMAGNVWEWVSDGWDPAPTGTTDPAVPTSMTLGVLRGGGWDVSAPSARAFARLKFTSNSGHVSSGVRCARDAIKPVANVNVLAQPSAGSVAAATAALAPEPIAPPPSATAAAVDPTAPRPGTLKRDASVAIIIGVEHYRRDLPVATGAASDAKLFADHAEQALGIPRRNIHVLVDSDATKSSIDGELKEWLVRNANPGGDAVFFFAGHGAPDPVTGATYLVPWDADPKFIKTQGVEVSALQTELSALPSTHVYAFLDSCFSGSGGRSVLAAGTRPLVREQTLKPVGAKLTMFTATGPNEITGAAAAGGGLFSHYLFRGMNGEADQSGDSQVTWGELAAYTAAKVADDARRENRDQHPSVVGADGLGDVVLVKR